jgi:deoxycytidine triphosphate deaminase
LPSDRLLLRFLGFTDLFQNERLHATELFLKTHSKIVRAVFEKNDEAKSEEYKENDPKYSAQQGHGGNPN